MIPGSIGSSIKFLFHQYKERPKRTLYESWTSFLVRAAPGLQGGLELELFWTSALVTRTELALDLLHDLDTFAGLLLLDAMHQTWLFA